MSWKLFKRTDVAKEVDASLDKLPERAQGFDVWVSLLGWTTTGVLAILTVLVIFSSQQAGAFKVFSIGLIVAAASMLVGGFVGFIFGVPKLAPSGVSEGRTSPYRPVVANTNLEQISDWLTKILVGVGLTQFATIGRTAQDLFDALAPSFGDSVASGKTFSGGLVIFSVTFGFVTGWLYSRLRLGEEMARADQRVQVAAMFERQADRAEKDGDSGTADELRSRAGEVLRGLADIGAAYEEARRSMPASPTRTAHFDKLAKQMREVAKLGQYDPTEVSNTLTEGGDGDRIAALAIMEVQPKVGNLEELKSVIADPRSANEQYQALRAVKAMVPGLGGQDRGQLRAFMEGIRASMSDSSRRALTNDIIRLLDRKDSQ